MKLLELAVLDKSCLLKKKFTLERNTTLTIYSDNFHVMLNTLLLQGTGSNVAPNKKFILELNEQGKALPHQTRKYVLYFSEEMTPHVHTSDNKILFTPKSGGQFNGIMQVAYIGMLIHWVLVCVLSFEHTLKYIEWYFQNHLPN